MMKFNLKTKLTFFILIFSIGFADAQNRKIDSLNLLIDKAVTDTGKINLKLVKIDMLGSINLDSAIYLGLKTLKESQNIRFYRGEVDVRIKLIYNYCYKGNFGAASEQLKFLEQIIKPLRDSADFADFYSVNGLFNGMQSKYDSSIYFYKKSIRIYERIGNRKRLAQSYSNIAIGYQQQSNFPEALLYFQKAIELYNKDKNETEIAYAYLNMAGTYSNLGDFSRSESTFLKTIEIAKKNLLKNVELYSYSDLSSLYINQQNWQKGYNFAIKAVELGNLMGDHGIQAASLSKASISLANLKEFDKALYLSKKAIFLADSSEQPFIINQAYSSMGFALMMQKNFKAAIPYYEKGLKSLNDADLYISEIAKIFKELSKCYEKTGDYTKALDMYKKSAVIKDSVRSKDNIQKATELTMNFEFNKMQESEKAIQQAKDDVTYARQVGLIVGLFLSFIIILGAFIGYYNKRKANTLLQQQKEEIENTLVKLKNTQAQLIHAEKLASLGEMTAGIAHEIKNPLNFVNNFSEVSTELIDDLKIELMNNNIKGVTQILTDLKQNLEKINQHGKRADSIVKGMLLHSRGTSGEKTLTDINDLLEQYVTLAYHGLRAKDKDFNITIEKNYDYTIDKINVVPQDISRVFLNIINNACYAVNDKKKLSSDGFNPVLKVSTKNLKDKVEIRIEDNGNGISQDILDKVFQPFFTTKPTGEGTGLGLSLSYDIVTKVHSGQLKIETKEREGSEFIITLPKNNL